MDRYRRYLKKATSNVLDDFTKLFPEKILRKVKLHLLVHLEDDIGRFGPLVGMSSERFESYNAVFRQSMVYSNRKRPSRDIATDCTGQERLKMMMSGAYIPDDGTW